jgi:uncharacterized protein (DUF305 family)
MSQSEMGMDMDPAKLNDAKAFDRAFIDMMLPHHRGAITMAEQLLKDGQNPELRKMARARRPAGRRPSASATSGTT